MDDHPAARAERAADAPTAVTAPDADPSDGATGPTVPVGAVGRVAGILDGTLDVAVGSVAAWTLIHAAMLAGLPLQVGFVLWAVVTAAAVALRVSRPWVRRPVPAGRAGTLLAMLLAAGAAGLASVMSRGEGDDAWYVVRSTWVADRGVVRDQDLLFSDGSWPATLGPVPNLSSIETLLGAVARYTGLPAGDVVYRYFVPLAAFAAVWALWGAYLAWGARRPALSLMLASTFLVLGGYDAGTFGNMHLGRIWQGKAVLVAVLVPYVYGVLVTAIRGRGGPGPSLRGTALFLGVVGVAAVGLSSTAVFVVPLIAISALPVLLWRREWTRCATVLALGVGPLAAGLVTVLSPVGARNETGGSRGAPWVSALADGRVAIVAVLAALVVILGVVAPAWWGTVSPSLQGALVGVLGVGLLVSVEPFYLIVTAVTGGDAIAHRLAWVLPLPALVGLIASLPVRRLGVPLVPVAAVTIGLLLVSGTPLWSPDNGVHLARPGSWKVRAPEDLVAARWVVDQEPEGRYLAANWVTFLVGTISSEPRPVGTRLNYLATIEDLPDSQYEARLVLQSVANGADARTPENRDPAIEALDALDVSVACVAWNDAFTDDVFGTAGFEVGFALGPWTCWSR